MTATQPFPLPAKLPSDLAKVHQFWVGLKRTENPMPFWDDVKLSSLPELSDRLMLIDAFANPVRFRFAQVGRRIETAYGRDLRGEFVDEIDPVGPFNYFLAQVSATVEARAPTFYHHEASGRESGTAVRYSRIVLPLWGDGRIGMLLGAVAFSDR